MLLEKIDGGEGVALGVVGAAEDYVEDVLVVLLAEPAALFCVELLPFLRSEVQVLCLGQDLIY